jgi:hypothetical protein
MGDIELGGMGERIKTALGNAAVVCASILICYAIGEVVFFRILLPHVTMNSIPYLPDRATFFLQTSKDNYVPRDYIALVGDSNAQGMGDWLTNNLGDLSTSHHSAHILHDLLKTDVVSVGRAASGSAEAMVLRVTRVYGDPYCYLFPEIDPPKRILIYFSESNDLDDNQKLLDHYLRPTDGDLRPQIDEFLERQYAVLTPWRCHGHLGDAIFRMARYQIKYRNYVASLSDAPAVQNVIINGAPVGAYYLSLPSVSLTDDQIDAAVVVYERSLAWLQRRFRDVSMTVVYIPSPAAIYRHAGPEVLANDAYIPITDPSQVGDEVMVSGTRFPVSAVYANSQKICEKIRAASLAAKVDFIDTRPPLQKAAAKRPMHGPKDWNHLNEAGYRLLGSYIASRLGGHPADQCINPWEPKGPD